MAKLNTPNEGQVDTLAQSKWLRLPQVISYCGLSRTKIFQLAKANKITSVSLREPGMKKATRLFLKESIDSYIESFLTNNSK
jgi:predicted DNA-binding transcriptional regulator AlpA